MDHELCLIMYDRGCLSERDLVWRCDSARALEMMMKKEMSILSPLAWVTLESIVLYFEMLYHWSASIDSVR